MLVTEAFIFISKGDYFKSFVTHIFFETTVQKTFVHNFLRNNCLLHTQTVFLNLVDLSDILNLKDSIW